MTPEPADTLRRPHRGRALISLIVGILAALALISGGGRVTTPPPITGRLTVGQAWPGAVQADLPDLLSEPKLFLDATTAVGTLPTRDAAFLQLVIEDADGRRRVLHRLPADDNPQYDTVTAAGDDLVWTESSDKQHLSIWTANARTTTPARRLTTDTGNAMFYDSQYDLIVAADRVYWTAGKGSDTTEIRSVALTGGPVSIRDEPGVWALSAWPWLTDAAGGDRSGTLRLRNMATGRDLTVASSGTELTTCAPAWCRVMVLTGDGLARIDLMHPDGTGRRRIAGPNGQAAVTDVAIQDRFEILAEAGPDSALTQTAGLLIYDIRTGHTVTLTSAAAGARVRNGVLSWSTGDFEALAWHTLDLRTA